MQNPTPIQTFFDSLYRYLQNKDPHHPFLHKHNLQAVEELIKRYAVLDKDGKVQLDENGTVRLNMATLKTKSVLDLARELLTNINAKNKKVFFIFRPHINKTGTLVSDHLLPAVEKSGYEKGKALTAIIDMINDVEGGPSAPKVGVTERTGEVKKKAKLFSNHK